MPGTAALGLYRMALQLRAFVALSAVPSAAVAGAGGDGFTEALLLAAAVSVAQAGVALVWGPRAVGLRVLLVVDLVTFALLQSLAGASFPVVYYAAGTAALVGLLRGMRSLPVTAALALAVCALVNAAPVPSVPLLAVVPPLFLAAGAAGAAARAAVDRAERVGRELALQRDRVAAAEERARLAREMHDTLLATLQGLHLSAQALLPMLGPDTGPGRERAAGLAGQLADSLLVAGGQARDLLRGLRSGPDPAPVRRLDEEVSRAVRRWSAGTGIPVDCRLARWPADDLPVDPGLRHEVLRVLSEALSNVDRHSRAGRVTVALTAGRRRLVLSVRDDGVGFDPCPGGSPGHYGLVGMAERADRLGGTLRVESAPGVGTDVVLDLRVRDGVRAGRPA